MNDARQVGCLRNVGEPPCYGQHMDIRTLGMRLKEARKRKGLSMKEAAALVNYSYQWVDNVEGGRREPTIADLTRLAEAVDMRLIVELVPQTAWPSVSVPPRRGAIYRNSLLDVGGEAGDCPSYSCRPSGWSSGSRRGSRLTR